MTMLARINESFVFSIIYHIHRFRHATLLDLHYTLSQYHRFHDFIGHWVTEKCNGDMGVQ